MKMAGGRGRVGLGLVASIALAVPLSACGSAEHEAGFAPGVVLQTLKLGLGAPESSAVNVPYYYGEDQGIFLKHGIELQAQNLTPTAAVAAMLNGDVDIAMDGEAVVSGIATSRKGKVIYAAGTNPLQLWAREPLNLPDLRGKVVAATTPGGTIDTALKRVLISADLTPGEDVQLTYLQTAPAAFHALQGGQVDAALLSPPSTVQAAKSGLHLIPANVSDEAAPAVAGVNGDFVAKNRDVVKRFVAAVAEATQSARDNPDDATAAFAKRNQSANTELLSGAVEAFVPAWEVSVYPDRWAREVLDKDAVTTSVPTSDVVDPSFVNEVGAVAPRG